MFSKPSILLSIGRAGIIRKETELAQTVGEWNELKI
jgi:hypothetical protein